MKLETIRQKDGNVASAQAEVIATIRKIPDSNEVLSVLTKSNKLFNKMNVKFAASNGRITLNGVNIDISNFGGLSKTEQSAFLLDLPPAPTPSAVQTLEITKLIKSVFSHDNIRVCGQVLTIPQLSFASLLNLFQPVIQEMLLKCVNNFIDSINFDITHIFRQVFPDRNIMEIMLRFVINFFKTKMVSYEQEYLARREQEMTVPDFNEKDFASRVNASEDANKRALIFFERAVRLAFTDMREPILKEMIECFLKWITEQAYIYEERKKLEEVRGDIRKQQNCIVCGGKYFSKK